MIKTNISTNIHSNAMDRRGILTTGIFQCKAAFMHLILLCRRPRQMMYIPRSVPLHLQAPRCERPLLPDQNVKIVISGMQPRVSLCAQRRAEYDEVLSDARVDDVHRAHRTAGVAEDPFVLARVEGNERGGIVRGEVRDDV